MDWGLDSATPKNTKKKHLNSINVWLKIQLMLDKDLFHAIKSFFYKTRLNLVIKYILIDRPGVATAIL